MSHKITLTMPADLTHSVLCAALESFCGSGYWASMYEISASACRGTYEAVKFGPSYDPDNDEKPKHSTVGAVHIAEALGLMLADPDHAECAARVIAGRFDAPDADRVLQFAVFGKLIYG